MRIILVLKTLMLQVPLMALVAVSHAAPASQLIPYYGEEFYDVLTSSKNTEEVKVVLGKIFNRFHVEKPNEFDDIVDSCAGKGRCYNHSPVTYTQARTIILGNMYLLPHDHGYAVVDVYCNGLKQPQDFKSALPGPGKIPNNNIINIEHTWPQSRFSRRYSDDAQKSDLHHLFPTDSQINSIRGNNPFGEVSQDTHSLDCPASRFGIGSAGTDDVFEPPTNHKGNVARALFYFSVRYEMPISSSEEAILRKWHQEDPVDEFEYQRNGKIFELQKNRNPFIDFPDLVDNINDF